ncbi:MAG: ABC transporter permease [Candidatus Aminicenantes bacterium]|nr:ABC transporter permease [Candidatus Aminicenantes bacterium]
MSALGRVFSFFSRLGKKSRRTQFFFVLSSLPVLLAVFLRLQQTLSLSRRNITGLFFYSNVILPFYVQFLVLMLALFLGTSIVLEEVEGRTLPYLISRPLPRPSIILGKYGASAMLALLMIDIGLVASFLILNAEGLGDLSFDLVLLRDLAVLDLGLLCYLALFTFLGALLKRAVLFGLLFCFGWENVLIYFPGLTQKLAIAHYLKSLIPQPPSSGFAFLRFNLEPSPPLTAVLVLIILTAVFLAAACLTFSLKEYLLEN